MSAGIHRGFLYTDPQAVRILINVNALLSNDYYHHSDSCGEDRMQGFAA